MDAASEHAARLVAASQAFLKPALKPAGQRLRRRGLTTLRGELAHVPRARIVLLVKPVGLADASPVEGADQLEGSLRT
jgi:hypothetical protein